MSGAQAARGPLAVAAVDLGATSGRVMLGILADGRVELIAAHRFENRLRDEDGQLSWDIHALWAEVKQGLRAAHAGAVERGLDGLASIGIDSWAVDYGLVGPDTVAADGTPVPGSGEVLGEVVAYRDHRTDGVADSFAEQVPRERQYALTGIAQQPFNTLYQLVADDRPATLPPARRC
ncbi:FGGY family carbohydrate kinase [Brachybacterium sp. Z12]|uniref:FGGY family carbohydrate kinase n=1 Tax=Brachybacterium sp. Z12 TaxID=2759167 RepID=UPI00223C4ACB|nr:FGGY family carbohydrate kinase [Brachybacterium sp. Z12]